MKYVLFSSDGVFINVETLLETIRNEALEWGTFGTGDKYI